MELNLDILNGLTLGQMYENGYRLMVYRMYWNQVYMKFLGTPGGLDNRGILEIYQDRSDKVNSIVGYKVAALGENDISVMMDDYEWKTLPSGIYVFTKYDRFASYSVRKRSPRKPWEVL
jgi:hypothetical protein